MLGGIGGRRLTLPLSRTCDPISGAVSAQQGGKPLSRPWHQDLKGGLRARGLGCPVLPRRRSHSLLCLFLRSRDGRRTDPPPLTQSSGRPSSTPATQGLGGSPGPAVRLHLPAGGHGAPSPQRLSRHLRDQMVEAVGERGPGAGRAGGHWAEAAHLWGITEAACACGRTERGKCLSNPMDCSIPGSSIHGIF